MSTLSLEDAVEIMLGTNRPPGMADPYPREAERLRTLLADRKINWDKHNYHCVRSVADVLTQIPDTDWIDNPPSQRFTNERDVTATILHAYEKHCEFVSAGGDYEDVDEAFWSDAWISKKCYCSMFFDPWIIFDLEKCPICGDICEEGDGTVMDPPKMLFRFAQNKTTFNAEWSCLVCNGRKSGDYMREHARSERHRFLLRGQTE